MAVVLWGPGRLWSHEAVETTRAALLLTDVVDSTQLVRTLGDQRAAQLWARHDSLARELLAPHGGREIDKTDGFLMLFFDADQAVAYAEAYHRALETVGEELGVPLTARVGLHVGDVLLRENPADQVARGAKPLEVEGIAKPTAARVMSLARGRQTLLSAAAAAALTDATTLRIQSHGFWRMKGLDEPVELFEIGGPDAPWEPPPDSAKVYRVVADGAGFRPVRELPSNLPPATDVFVPRREHLHQLAAAVQTGTVVTLTGPPGIGKTRLATRFARSWAGDFPGGTWLVRPGEELPPDLRDALVILDAADGPPPAGLEHTAVLVTRRVARPDSRGRVVPLDPLTPEESAALYAAREGAGAPAHVARLMDVLGGQPGPIERAARASRGVGLGDGPYRGLESFRAEDADLFFGRDAEARSLAERMLDTPLLTVTGPSGAGKSSLLQAGVRRFLPGRPILTMRPGVEPLSALERVLDTAPAGPAVLVVDQAEELVTITALEHRQHFGARLVALADAGRFTVVLSVRGDFFARLAELESLRGRYSRTVEVVVTPGPGALREILVQPLARFGALYEDDALVDAMVAAVEGEPSALALLQFCASRLWTGRDGLVLTRAAYDAIGGVEGALAGHADEVVAGFTPVQRREARRILLRLITEDLTREPRPRSDLVESAPDPEAAQAVLDQLVRSRLLATAESADGGAVVEIVHEALIRHWDQLAGWLQEDREGHRTRRALAAAVGSWERRGRSPDLLWRGEVLAELRRWRRRTEPRLTRLEDAFVEASERAHRSRIRRRRAIVAAAFLTVIVGAVGALVLWQRAEDAAQAAELSAADARNQHQIAVADRERITGNGLNALRLARDVLNRDPTATAARTVLGAMVVPETAALRLQTTSDQWPPWNKQMDRFVVHEPETVIRGAKGELIARIDADSSRWRIARWSHDGRWLAGWNGDQLHLWTADGVPVVDTPAKRQNIAWRADSSLLTVRAADGESLLRVHTDGRVESVDASAPRRMASSKTGVTVTLTDDAPLQLRDPSGAVLASAGAPGCVSTVELSEDGQTVASYGSNHCDGPALRIWGPTGPIAQLDMAGAPGVSKMGWNSEADHLLVKRNNDLVLASRAGVEIPLPEDLCRLVDSFSWHPRGDRFVVTCEYTDIVSVVSITGEVLSTRNTNPTGTGREENARGVHAADWSPDGSRFATVDHAGSLGVWTTTDAAPPFSVDEPGGCWFSPDGAWVASRGRDGTANIFTRAGVLEHRLEDTSASDWDPTGRRFAQVGASALRLVELDSGDRVEIPMEVGIRSNVAWNPSATRLAVVGGSAALLVDTTKREARPLEAIAAGVGSRGPPLVVWSPDGERLLVARDEGSAWLFSGDGELLKEFERGRNVAAYWHPSNDRFQVSASPWESFGTVYDRDGNELRTTDGVVLSAWSPEGHWLVSRKKEAFLVDAATEAVIRPIPTPHWAWEGSWTDDGAWMVVRSAGPRWSLWSGDGQQVLEFAGGDMTPGCLDPRGEWFLTAGEDRLLRWPVGGERLLEAADALAPQRELLKADRTLLR